MDLSILKNKTVQLSAVISAGNFFYSFLDRVNRDLFIVENTSNDETDITRIFEKIILDKETYGFRISKTRISVCEGTVIWVPQEFFHDEKVTSYVKNFYSPEHLEKMVLQKTVSSDLQAVGIYLLPIAWQNIFNEIEPIPLIRHSLHALVQYSLRQISSANFVLGMVEKNQLQIVVVKNKQLVFSNVFVCENADAYIYYINLAYSLHGLSREDVPLYLAGEINIDSDLHELIYRYFKLVHFTSEGMDYKFHVNDLTPHRYLNIHSLNLCE